MSSSTYISRSVSSIIYMVQIPGRGLTISDLEIQGPVRCKTFPGPLHIRMEREGMGRDGPLRILFCVLYKSFEK